MARPRNNTTARAALTREPELLEKLFLYLERRNIFHSVSVSVHVRGAHIITRDLAFASLRRLVLKYPLLFLFPEGEEPRIRWQPLEVVRFNEVFEIHTGETGGFGVNCRGSKLLNGVSMAQRHQQRKPLWKMVYYQDSGWLSLHCAHCFTDGGLIVAYLKEFVEGLNSEYGGKIEAHDRIFREGHSEVYNDGQTASQDQAVGQNENYNKDLDINIDHHEDGNTNYTKSPNEAENVLFNLEQDLPLLTTGISPRFFDRVAYKPDLGTWLLVIVLRVIISLFPMLVPAILDTHLQNLGFVDRFPVPYTRRLFFACDHVISEHSLLNAAAPHFVNIPPAQLEGLVAACRSHKVKLQTYMVLVYVHTVHQLYPALYAHKFLKVGVPVSLRNVFPHLLSHNSFLGNSGRFDDGFYALSIKFFLDPGTASTFTWLAVQKYHDFLHRTINSPTWINRYYVASKTMNAEHYMRPRVGIKKDDCFLICTNLGHIELLSGSSCGRFYIDNILFAPSSGSTIGAHHMTICSTKTAGLNIGFSDGDRNIDDWDLFRTRFRENLVNLLNEAL